MDMRNLDLRIQKSYELNYQAAAKVEPLTYSSKRQRLVLSALHLAIDHHMSFVALVKLRRYASAAALLRPIGEATASAYWFTYVADNKRLDGILSSEDGRQDTPDLDDMIRALASSHLRIPGVDILKKLIKEQNPLWRRFHKYAHGGMIQLNRRMEPETFSNDENSYHLMVADSFMLPSIKLVAAVFANTDLANFCKDNYKRIAKEVESYGSIVAPEMELPPAPYFD